MGPEVGEREHPRQYIVDDLRERLDWIKKLSGRDVPKDHTLNKALVMELELINKEIAFRIVVQNREAFAFSFENGVWEGTKVGPDAVIRRKSSAEAAEDMLKGLQFHSKITI